MRLIAGLIIGLVIGVVLGLLGPLALAKVSHGSCSSDLQALGRTTIFDREYKLNRVLDSCGSITSLP